MNGYSGEAILIVKYIRLMIIKDIANIIHRLNYNAVLKSGGSYFPTSYQNYVAMALQLFDACEI